MADTRHPGAGHHPAEVNRRALLQAGLGLGAASVVSLGATRPGMAQAAKAPSQTLIDAAQKEGTLTFYHTTPIELTANWTAAFTKKYGIKTQNVRGPSYPLFDRWLAEERVGKHIADVIQITDTVLIESAHSEKLVADYVPAEDAAIRASMKKSGVWYTAFVNVMGLMYNTTRVTPEEDKLIRDGGWGILTDPRWKGRFATATPASGGSSYVAVYMYLGGLRDRFGPEFCAKLAAHKPTVYESKAPMYDRIAAGEHALADQASQSDMGGFYLNGAPVRWLFPDPAPANLTVQCISANAPKPNAARLFQEWMVSSEAQAEWFRYSGVLSAREDTVDPRKAAKADWYKEDWYRDPTNLYINYLSDPGFIDPKKPIIAEWNKIFGRA